MSQIITEQFQVKLYFRDVSPEFQELYDLWNNMAEVSNLDGSSTFKLATVDCKINSKLCQHQGITDPVAVKFFNNGVKDAKSNDMMPFFKSTIQEEIDRFLLTEKLKTGTHVVQFYTPNCPHCKALKPIWTRFTKDYDTNENISLLKCNCKINRKLCSKFGISKYPCVYKFEDGKLTVKFEGSRTEGELKDFIEKAFIQSRSRRSLPVADPYKSSSANELEISETDFDKVIAKDFTCVLFYISGCAYCKDIIKTWGRLADYFANNDTIKIGRVNCMSNYDLCSKDSNGSPTVNMYGNGALMRKDWHEDDSLKALIKFVECYVAGGEGEFKASPFNKEFIFH